MKNGWAKKRLGDVVTRLTNGYVGPTRNIYLESGFPYLLARHVRDNQLTFDGKTFVSDEFNQKHKKSMLKAGDVLLVQSGHIGHSAVVPNDHEGHNCHAMIVITPVKDTVTGPFLSLYFDSPEMEQSFERIRSGSTVPHLTCRAVKELQIPLPPLPEQERIVAILDEAFAAIATATANAEKNLANAREVFDRELNRVLSQGGDAWTETTLGDLCERMEYGSSAKSSPVGKVPVLRMGNIQEGVINWDDLKFTSDEDEIEKYLLNPGDVLFNRTNSAELVGKTAIYRGEQPAVFAGYLIRVHYRKDLLGPEFLNFYLSSYRAREYGRTMMSRSVNQANINATKLKSYPITIPPVEEQRSIAASLEALSEETHRLESIYQQKLAALDELKKSLLQQAFSGELTADSNAVDHTLSEAGA